MFRNLPPGFLLLMLHTGTEGTRQCIRQHIIIHQALSDSFPGKLAFQLAHDHPAPARLQQSGINFRTLPGREALKHTVAVIDLIRLGHPHLLPQRPVDRDPLPPLLPHPVGVQIQIAVRCHIVALPDSPGHRVHTGEHHEEIQLILPCKLIQHPRSGYLG
ncbi:hypothetical protein D3C73_1086290 [compost metagenome]